MLGSFRNVPLAREQRDYLLRALDWGADHSKGFQDHWDLWRTRMEAGRVSVVAEVFRGAEGLFNALTGGLYLSSSRLPLEPRQCAWALSRWEEPLVLQALVDVTAVIVHESSHALAGFWGSLRELGPYQSEADYLRQLAAHEKLQSVALSRLEDLVRDAWECEKIRL
jgi:hypothetical protein